MRQVLHFLISDPSKVYMCIIYLLISIGLDDLLLKEIGWGVRFVSHPHGLPETDVRLTSEQG